MSFKILSQFSLTTLAIFYMTGLGTSLAQEIPAALAALPTIDQERRSGLFIDSQRIETYREFLPAEIYSLVRAGEMHLDLGKWSPELVDAKWKSDSLTPTLKALSERSLPIEFRFPQSLPFGDRNALASFQDSNELGRRLLWNTAAVPWSLKVFSVGFDLYLFKPENFQTLQASFERIYPGAVASQGSSPQIFREKFGVTSPAALNGLAWLTFRLQNNTGDIVWIASPAIGKVREVTATNRGEPLFGSAPATEDLLVWSGKVEDLDILKVERVFALAPLSSLPTLELAADGSVCSVFSKGSQATLGKGSAPSLNYLTQEFPQEAPWMPMSTIFSPRQMWRIEVASRDPFALSSKQLFYVDAETMIPLYKVVYDRLGVVRRVVFGVLGSVAFGSGENRRVVPLPLTEIGVDPQTGGGFVLAPHSIKICNGYQENLTLQDFDPAVLAKTLAEMPKGQSEAPKVLEVEKTAVAGDDND